jgi:hypothetical protein
MSTGVTSLPRKESPDNQGFGMMLVAPLSAENIERTAVVTAEIAKRLGINLWTPHADITLGRILPRGKGETPEYWEQRFARTLPLATQILRGMALETAPFVTTFEVVTVSSEAIVAETTRGTELLAAFRTSFVDVLSLVPECEPTIKNLEYVHTTLGRFVVADVPIADVECVAAEVLSGAKSALPFTEVTKTLVIAEEPRAYELIPREEFFLQPA